MSVLLSTTRCWVDRVQVAEAPLQRARAQRVGAGGGVREPHRVGGDTRGVGRRLAQPLALHRGGIVAGLEHVLHDRERLVHERARRLQRGVVHRVVVTEQLLVAQRIGAEPVLGLHDAGELVHPVPSDAEGEGGVAGGCEPEHPEPVHRATAPGLGDDEVEGEVLTDRLLGDLVVVAPRTREPHHVPVAEELHPLARHEVGADHRHAGLPGHELAVAQLERAAADPRRVRAPAAEAVLPRHDVAVAGTVEAHRGAARRELPRGHRDAIAGEHLGHRRRAGVHARERGGGGVGEQRPAGGTVGAAHLLVHREHGGQVGLLAAELLRDHEPEQPRFVERVDDDGRERGVGFRTRRLVGHEAGQALRLCERCHQYWSRPRRGGLFT